MRILFANNQEFNPQIGGVEKVSIILSEAFQEMGHLCLFTAAKKSKYHNQSSAEKSQLISVSSEEIKFFITSYKIDIIINQSGSDATYTELITGIAKSMHLPIVSVLHIDPFFRYKVYRDIKTNTIRDLIKTILLPIRDLQSYYALKKQYTNLVTNSDRTILLSNQYTNRFYKYIPNNCKSKVDVIANPNPYTSIHISAKDKVILSIGRIDQGKAVNRLIQIWEKINSTVSDWQLHIVGDGLCKQDLVQYVYQKHIPNIVFNDYQDPISEYQNASIICMTSRFEGLPMVLIEAMSFGCIPIAYNSFNSVYDIIDDGVSGFIIPNKNSQVYAEALIKLMQSEDLRQQISLEARKKSLDFSPETITQKWITLLEDLIVHNDYQ